ncbi:hypothetical protein TNCV_3586611 [Trichonephila clavipes]|nr:hypothetical protein TNCV_3586611 [Trichonephila clavipes]
MQISQSIEGKCCKLEGEVIRQEKGRRSSKKIQVDCAISVSLIIRQRSTVGKFDPPENDTKYHENYPFMRFCKITVSNVVGYLDEEFVWVCAKLAKYRENLKAQSLQEDVCEARR